MNWYIFSACTAGLFLLAGIIMIELYIRHRKKMEDRKMQYATDILLPEIRKTVIRAMEQSMEMIPEKIAEARKALEE